MDIVKDITPWIPIITALFSCFTILIASGALYKGFKEYSRQNAIKRAEYFFELRRRLKEKEIFIAISGLLEDDDLKLQKIPYTDRRDFLGLFEEVAIAMNSRLIKKRVVHYMFGYYVILCWNSVNFWVDIDRDNPYWTVFRDFARQMIEEKFNYKPQDLVF